MSGPVGPQLVLRRGRPPRPAWRWLVVAVGCGGGAVVAAEPLLGLAAVLAAFLAMVVASRPDWATLAAVGLLYSNAAVVAHRVHGLPKPVGHAAALLLLVALTHHFGVRRAPFLVPPALPWLVIYLIVQVIGATRAIQPIPAFEAVQDFVTGGFFLFVVFVNAIRTESVLRKAIWLILVVGAVLGTLSLHQSATRSYESDYLGFAQVKDEAVARHLETLDDEEGAVAPRLGGPIGEKNYYAQIMYTLVPVGLLLFGGHPRRGRRMVALVLTGLVAAGGALTVSRGGAVALVLSLMVLAALRFIPARHLILVALGFGLLLASSPRYVERLTSIPTVTGFVSEDAASGEVDSAALGRMGANVAAVRVFADHPIVGVGPGMFNIYYREQAIESGLRVHEDTRAAHNLFLQIAAETGLVGFLALFGAVGVTLRDLLRERRRWLPRRPELAALLGASFAALVTYLAAGIFLSLAYERYFWFLLAVGVAAVGIASNAEDPAQVAQHVDEQPPLTVRPGMA